MCWRSSRDAAEHDELKRRQDGFLLNFRGATVKIDPLLGGFDMPIIVEFGLAPEAVPRPEAFLISRSDNDHYSIHTCRRLAPVIARSTALAKSTR